MRKTWIVIAGIIALVMLLIPVIVYISVHGVEISSVHGRWGEFGSFFGGVLSPLYALLGFFGLLITVSLQASGLRQAREDFKKSYEATQKQLNHLEESSFKEDVFRIIKAIDNDIEALLQTDLSEPTDPPRTTPLRHMMHEAHRLRNDPVKVGAYGKFIAAAKDTGSIVEAVYSRLVALLYDSQRYLELYGTTSSRKPVVEYFARKNANLIQVFIDVGGVNQETIDFFSPYKEKAAASRQASPEQ